MEVSSMLHLLNDILTENSSCYFSFVGLFEYIISFLFFPITYLKVKSVVKNDSAMVALALCASNIYYTSHIRYKIYKKKGKKHECEKKRLL